MMKKTLTLLIIFLTVGIANAQTREEALDWLKTNASLAFVPLKVVSPMPMYWTKEEWNKFHYEDGSRIEDISQDSLEFKGNWGWSKIKFNEILFEEDLEKMEKILDINSGGFIYHGFLLVIKMTNNRRMLYYTTPEKEADIKRVLKAIMHIAKLSGAKENKHIF